MTGHSSRCPDPEAIAAFVMGNLSGAELKMMADHLRDCEDCREIAAEAARIDREGIPGAAVVPIAPAAERRRPWWLLVAAAALIGFFILALWSMRSPRDTDLMAPLIDASPRTARYLEPRLSGGFPYAPLRVVRRTTDEPLDPEQMKLIGAAGNVLEATAKRTSVEAQHAAAVAHLLAGRPGAAADLLTKTAAASKSARIWSDLAAMHFAAAVRSEDPTRFGDALAAVDAALRIDPRFSEALFNRALILEHLGLRDQARAAWERYLAVDGSSPWANEARRHLQRLLPAAKFRDELQRQYAVLVRDPAAVRALATRFPLEVRLWGETEILGRWADAYQHGNDAEAENHLRVARAFGREVERHGDFMLTRVVASVDAAGPEQRKMLAQAHLDFRSAQQNFRADASAAAEKLFRKAAVAFERSGSPAVLLARYFLANTAFVQGRLDDADEILASLETTAPPDYPAHRAQVLWQLGVVRAARGEWGQAIHCFRESVSTFDCLGEKRYAAFVQAILAETYDRVGDRQTAWEHRIASLRQIGRLDPESLPGPLDAAARAAAVNGEWDISLSLRNIEIGLLEKSHGPLYVMALLQRARMLARLADRDSAMADLTRASAAMQALHDPDRERADVDRMVVEALLAPSPEAAIPLLSRAMDFHSTKGRRMFLPELLLMRGKAYASRSDHVAAANDFEAGIRELETQRNTVSASERGWGNFAIARELFDEAIELALARGDRTGAFLYAERSRARDEGAGSPLVEASSAAMNGTVVVEYAVLPEQIAIFIVDGPTVRAVVQPAKREDLAADVSQMITSAMGSDVAEFRRQSTALSRRLVAPVAVELDHARTLIFVPDATLDSVPFSALVDRDGRYLVERHAVIVSPSRAAFARLAAQQRKTAQSLRLLLITGPSSRPGDVAGIEAVQREAKAVAAAYGAAYPGAPNPADPEAFARRAADADVIHFVGHAVIPDGSDQAALVTARDDGIAGRMEARDIAAMKLQRTRIVVLAACGTARSRERPGQTNISVARAFLSAGVPTVVATLWPIDDEPAADFFPRFHRHLVRGLSAAEALRAAQLESIQLPETPPSLWAAVQIIGS